MSEGKTLRIEKDGHLIDSVDTWFQFAPPKEGKKQWVDGRSAKELAKAWFPTPGVVRVPTEMAALLASNPAIARAQIRLGHPEEQIKLDDFPGETRNADLVLLAEQGDERILLTVEAKADEPFDVTIDDKLKSASQGSNIPKRVDHLCKALLGVTPAQKPSLGQLRYQLLHGIAATLIAARDKSAKKAVFVVHEFATDKTDAQKMKGNHADLVAFVGALSEGKIQAVDAGRAVGPLTVPGGTHVPGDIQLFVGKIRTEQKR